MLEIITDYMPQLASGFLMNILITLAASVLPLIFGIGIYLILHFAAKDSKAAIAIIKYISAIPECLCPLIFILLFYIGINQVIPINAVLISIICLTICFIGYLPVRYSPEKSLAKNIVVNLLDMLSSIYMWSFCAGTIGVGELFKNTKAVVGITYQYIPTVTIAVILSFIVLLLLKLCKRLAEDLMK